MSDDRTVRLTYAELARARGITQAAAKRMALRHRWPKQIGNDGLSRVSVPASALVRLGSDASDDTSVIANGDARGDTSDDAGNAAPSLTGLPLNGAVLAAIIDIAVAAGDDARAAAMADASADARRVVRALEESIALLRDHLATERLLRAEDKERAQQAENRVSELQESLRPK